jgi:hypothetical protein
MKPEESYPHTIKTPKYAIVDENGEILEKFKHKITAQQMLKYYSDKYFPMKLKIVRI